MAILGQRPKLLNELLRDLSEFDTDRLREERTWKINEPEGEEKKIQEYDQKSKTDNNNRNSETKYGNTLRNETNEKYQNTRGRRKPESFIRTIDIEDDEDEEMDETQDSNEGNVM